MTKSELDSINDAIEAYNTGIFALRLLLKSHPQLVRTKLGKDQTLDYYITLNNTNEIFGNEIELAVGQKRVLNGF